MHTARVHTRRLFFWDVSIRNSLRSNNINREFRKKHAIAQVKAQIQAQVKVANPSRNTKMKGLNELQLRGQAFRDDWCEVEPIHGWRARSQQTAEQQVRKLPTSRPVLTSSPVTRALQICESSASRRAVPNRLQRSPLLSRTIQACLVYAPEKRISVPALA